MSAAELRRLVNGYQISNAIHVAATLGLADLLADGPKESVELAAVTDSDADAMYRLLRALASVGVFREDEGKVFGLTELGDGLRSDADDSIADWAVFVGRRVEREAWGSLSESVRTGENAFRLAHGVDVWEYRAQHPEEGAVFDRAMSARSRVVIPSLLGAYDFGRFGTIVDVGGGNGTLLAALLDEYPQLRGVLFDQPHVVDGVNLERCEVFTGSFFEAVPDGGDAYLLKWIIHDWEDEEATAILRTVRKRNATVLLVERIVGPPNETPEVKLIDLDMLVGPGGRERTLDEFEALFEAAAYRLVCATPTADGLHVIEGVPV